MRNVFIDPPCFPEGPGGGGAQHLLLDGLVSYLREDDSGVMTPIPKADYASALSMLQRFMSKSWYYDLYFNYIVRRNEGEIVAVIQALGQSCSDFHCSGYESCKMYVRSSILPTC